MLDSKNGLKTILINLFLSTLLIGGSLTLGGNNFALERTQKRMSKLENDGGSGRDKHILIILDKVDKSSALNFLFGHGYMGHYVRYKGNFDVDFFAILYYYGLIGWFVYLILHASIITKLVSLYRRKKYWGEKVINSYISCYVLFLFYSFAAEPFTYHFFFILLFVYLGLIECFTNRYNMA